MLTHAMVTPPSVRHCVDDTAASALAPADVPVALTPPLSVPPPPPTPAPPALLCTSAAPSMLTTPLLASPPAGTGALQKSSG